MAAKGTTKSGGQKHALDKFYTKPEIAKVFIDKCDVNKYNTVIEPSAGSGAFSNQIEGCIAYDLEPESKNIKKQDWFTYTHKPKKGEKILVIGNPPFGQQNSLAIGFINHAAKFADSIAFILPLSFKKDSVKDRVDKHFHLVFEEELPKSSFTLNDLDYDVKCVFQIWEKRSEKREKTNKENLNKNSLFSYVKKSDNPDISIQRVGGNAGKAFIDYQNRSEASNYFVKFNKSKSAAEIEKIVVKLNNLNYPSREFAVGPRSISKDEMNSVINSAFKA